MFLLLISVSACGAGPFDTSIDPIQKATVSSTATATPVASTATVLSSPSATPKPTCTEEQGQLLEQTYTGYVYGEQIPYLVYLPPCYAGSPQAYPGVYLLHGYPFDQTHWLDLEFLQAYEKGLQNGRWPAVIFVLPNIPEPLQSRTDGGPASYEEEFLEGLLPAVAAKFHLLAEADQRVLAGVSRGGVWALEIGLRNADQIAHVVAVSPALNYNRPRAPYDPFVIVREDRTFPETLFLSTAENEGSFRQKIEEFVAVLDQERIPYTLLLHPGVHTDATWVAIIEEIIEGLMMGLTR
jgi:enterochelin esterase-like enzyme